MERKQRIVAIKNVTINEPHFAGHFPDYPIMPGVLVVEAMAQAGGIGMLKALGGPFPDHVFCPTGGITRANAADFLALPNVLCVGGSWITPPPALQAGDWATIESLARDAASLRDERS